MLKELVKKRSIVVGVTGQLSSGKSSVCAMMAALGASVINADLLAHRALRKNGACFKKVVSAFGKDILDKGEIDRSKLAAIVFASPLQLRKLEGIIHPFVIKATQKEALLLKKSGKKIIVLDVPLLFESGMDKFTDLTVVVKVNQKTQMQRCLKQGRFSRHQALMRIRFQWPMGEKARRADIIIDNGGTLIKTQKQVNAIIEMIKRRYITFNNTPTHKEREHAKNIERKSQ